MAYDYLNTTTYENQLQDQEDMLQYMMDQENAPEGTGDLETIEPDLIEMLGKEDGTDEPSEEQPEPEENAEFNYDDDDTNTDMEFLNFLFDEKDVESQGGNSIGQARNFVDGVNPDLNWLKTKTNNVKLGGLNANISKYLSGLPANLRSGLVATSGNDDTHAEGSKHYGNNAIDLRFNQQAYDFISNDPVAKNLGLKVLNPNHGTAKHIHLESKQYGGKYQNFGGKTLFADSEEVLRRGLNNPSYNDAVLKLTGSNTIRGLDNYQPVSVTDGSKYEVLTGPQDTAQFNGSVYEKRLK